MSYGSDEVAADFTEALLGLNLNSRWEISNLTVIAKENTEHALAISEALKTHIKQVGRIFHCLLLDNLVLTYISIMFGCNSVILYLQISRLPPRRSFLLSMSSTPSSKMSALRTPSSLVGKCIIHSWMHMLQWTIICEGRWMRC